MTRFAVSVPATSANLGSGYDAFGLALGLGNTFTAELAEEWTVEVRGEGETFLKTDGSNALARAMARLFEEAGVPGRAARIVSENRIPTGRGLGSSAAVIVGGLLLGNALADEQVSDERLIELATEMEGHPDNVAAAFYGGFTISSGSGERAIVHPVPVHEGLAAVVAVSRLPLQTRRSRKLLPSRVPHGDAAFNAGRAGMLAAGLVLGDRELIAAGMRDRLHEQYREPAVAGFARTVAALVTAGAAGAALSGAGPTVIGLVTGRDDEDALARAQEVAATARDDVVAAGGHREPLAVRIERTRPRVEPVA